MIKKQTAVFHTRFNQQKNSLRFLGLIVVAGSNKYEKKFWALFYLKTSEVQLYCYMYGTSYK